jgi:hypothetical protein
MTIERPSLLPASFCTAEKWEVPTALLLSYAVVHTCSFAASAQLFLQGGSELSTFSALGLAAVVGLSAGLVYENGILAAGGSGTMG